MSGRKLVPTMRKLVTQHSLAAVLGALTDVCSAEVARLIDARARDSDRARPWSRVACKLEELAIYSAGEEL